MPASTDPAVADSPPEPKARAPEFYKPDSYNAEESVGHMMRRITTMLGQTVGNRMSEPSGPTFPQWAPLYKLHLGTATTVAELARECQLDTGAMTRLLDRLEAKGLCRRVRSVSDRRVVNIELTDEGRDAARQVPHVLCGVQNELLEGFSREEWMQLKSYLRRLLDNAQAVSARGENNDNTSN
ncbi:MarR family winged helix-turn-helix transcriptional regulator [Variovorax sp. KK3]|uniref:MarR family winged helix-turn-helix transcriptional regulator n=1 Tax=Variovorax sp. KK3 TaxID=1855728 RepID=UPI00097BEF2F|nr:MarR family winged helix-turn-helix transcriptional regulator [Variovorax sp. KK3]